MVDTVRTIKTTGGDYSSLSAWEAGQQKVIAAGDVEIAECYSFSDTTAVTIDGWTTVATGYIRIYTPAAERHDGKWNTSKYRLETTESNRCFEDYTRFEGLQISLNAASAWRVALNLTGAGSNIDGALVDSCIVRNISATTDQTGIQIYGGSVESVVRNSIVYDFSTTGSVGVYAHMATNTSRLDNITAHNCTVGFYTGYLDTIARNCLAASCADGFNVANDWAVGSSNNASTLASDSPGTSSRDSQTFTFVDEAGDDFHLASTDAGALGYGIDLSATFTIDIDGVTRTGTWDIGADEYVAAGGAITGAITFSFAPVGVLTGTGNMTGAISATLIPAGALTGTGSLTGSVSAAFSITGALTGAGALIGSVPVAFDLTGAMTGTGALSGSVSSVFDVTGSLTGADSGAMTGLVSFAFDTVGGLTGTGSLVSVIPVVFDLSGSLTGIGQQEQQPSGGGSWKPYRYLLVQEQYKKRKEYDEEELKRLILEAEGRNREEIELLTKKSEQLYNEGKSLAEIREVVNSTKRDLEDHIQAELLFDIDVQLKVLEIKRMKKMALLLLLSAA